MNEIKRMFGSENIRVGFDESENIRVGFDESIDNRVRILIASKDSGFTKYDRWVERRFG